MAMNAGDATCTSGLAQVIYNYLSGDASCGFSSPLSDAQTTALKHLAYRLAQSTVTYVQAHAEVNITVPADAFGAGIPASEVTLSGTVS